MAVCRVCGVQTEFGHADTRAFKRADHFICQLALHTMGSQTTTDDAAGGVKCNGCRLIIDQVLSRLQSAPVGASSWSPLKKMRTAKTHHDDGAIMVPRSDLSALVSMGADAFTLAFSQFSETRSRQKNRAAARLRAAEELDARFAFKVGDAVTVDVDTTPGVNGTGFLPGGHGTVVTRREVQGVTRHRQRLLVYDVQLGELERNFLRREVPESSIRRPDELARGQRRNRSEAHSQPSQPDLRAENERLSLEVERLSKAQAMRENAANNFRACATKRKREVETSRHDLAKTEAELNFLEANLAQANSLFEPAVREARVAGAAEASAAAAAELERQRQQWQSDQDQKQARVAAERRLAAAEKRRIKQLLIKAEAASFRAASAAAERDRALDQSTKNLAEERRRREHTEAVSEKREAVLIAMRREKERQKKNRETRRKRNGGHGARTLRRARDRCARLESELSEARRLRHGGASSDIMVKTRKSDAARSHVTGEGACAFLKLRDAGRIATSRLADNVNGFDAFRVDGKSFNLRPPARSTIAELDKLRFWVCFNKETDEIEVKISTAICGVLFSDDMTSYLGNELWSSAFVLTGSFVKANDMDIDGQPRYESFASKYENPLLALGGKTVRDVAKYSALIPLLQRQVLCVDTTAINAKYSALIPLLQRQVLCVDTTASTPSTLR